VERRSLPAAGEGAAVVQLTHHAALESQHTYYDICPWSHDERFIVFSSAPVDGEWTPFGHDTLACREGRVNVLDTASLEIRELAGDAVYMRHGGAFCLWHPNAHRVYYRRDEEHSAALDIATGETRLLSGRIRQLSPDGTHFATVARAPHGGGQGRGIGVLAEDGSGSRELVSREQLYALTPNRDEFRPEDMLLGNTKWRPDGRYILVAMWVHPRPAVRRSLYIVSRDGADVRWLTHFAHHHSWTPDGQGVLFNDREPVGNGGALEPRMLVIDVDGGNRRILFDAPIGSHPLLSPDGGRVLDADAQGIYVVRLGEGAVERLADFARPFDTTHHGTHPHPVWNHDGTRVLYNSGETGHSEVYLIAGEP
jgi:hypothetical protein